MGLVVAPTVADVIFYQGASFKQSFQWKHGDAEETAAPVNLTTASARSQVRKNYAAATVYLAFSSDDGEIALDANGNLEINVGADKTALVPAGSAVWDLEVVWADGDVCRLLMGKVTVIPEVTKSI